MPSRVVCTALALVAMALVASPVYALIETLEVTDDDRHAFHIDSFGYEPGGKFEITLTDFQLLVPPEYEQPQPGKIFNIAFVLQRSSSDSSVRIESGTCFHESQMTDEDNRIFVPSTAILPPRDTFVYKLDIKTGGYYHLYFSNCEPATQVDFKLKLVEYNTDTGSEVYLSAGEQSLPTWFFVLCLAFVVQLVVWIVTVRKNSDNVRNIHHLMTVVLVLKLLSLFFLSMKYHSLKYKGHADGWAVAYFIFAFLKGMMMFTVIVLIGTGWSYLKPFLTERDKQTMLVMLVFQFMFNVAALVLEETTPGAAGWITWRDILYLLDMICCCIILLPIMWSIRHLREAAEVDGKAARNMVRLKRFRTFYLLVVSYVYFTRIVVFLLNATLPFELTWLGTVISEVATLAFYGITGWLFRPQPQNPYLALDTDDGTGAAAVVPSAEVEL